MLRAVLLHMFLFATSKNVIYASDARQAQIYTGGSFFVGTIKICLNWPNFELSMHGESGTHLNFWSISWAFATACGDAHLQIVAGRTTYLILLNCRHTSLGDSVPRSSPGTRPGPGTLTFDLCTSQGHSASWRLAGWANSAVKGYLKEQTRKP